MRLLLYLFVTVASAVVLVYSYRTSTELHPKAPVSGPVATRTSAPAGTSGLPSDAGRLTPGVIVHPSAPATTTPPPEGSVRNGPLAPMPAG